MMYIMMQNPMHDPNPKPGHQVFTKILELHWHTGGSLPAPLNDHNKHLIVAVQADGDELEAIINNCWNLPYIPRKAVQTWRGEMAQFIVDNLVDAWVKK